MEGHVMSRLSVLNGPSQGQDSIAAVLFGSK